MGLQPKARAFLAALAQGQRLHQVIARFRRRKRLLGRTGGIGSGRCAAGAC